MNSPITVTNLRSMIQETLQPLGIYSLNAEELLCATCANESDMGTYRVQVGSGVAKGIFQMEAEDFNDIWLNYLPYHATLGFQIKNINHGTKGTVDDLINNDPYAIAMTRVHYMRAPGELPAYNDIQGIWLYYKHYYNTLNGAATEQGFMAAYNKYVLGQ